MVAATNSKLGVTLDPGEDPDLSTLRKASRVLEPKSRRLEAVRATNDRSNAREPDRSYKRMLRSEKVMTAPTGSGTSRPLRLRQTAKV